MAISDDTADAISELLDEFGETVTWRPSDDAVSHELNAYVTGNTVIMLKSAVAAVSPDREPQNGDTITNEDGVEAHINSVNGAFDQVMDGGFSEQPSLRSGNQVFYRILCGADITR